MIQESANHLWSTSSRKGNSHNISSPQLGLTLPIGKSNSLMTRSACYKSGIQPVRRDFNHCHQPFTEGQIAAVWCTILQAHKVSKVYRNGNHISCLGVSPKTQNRHRSLCWATRSISRRKESVRSSTKPLTNGARPTVKWYFTRLLPKVISTSYKDSLSLQL